MKVKKEVTTKEILKENEAHEASLMAAAIRDPLAMAELEAKKLYERIAGVRQDGDALKEFGGAVYSQEDMDRQYDNGYDIGRKKGREQAYQYLYDYIYRMKFEKGDDFLHKIISEYSEFVQAMQQLEQEQKDLAF